MTIEWITAEKVYVGRRFTTGRWLGIEDGRIRAVEATPPPPGARVIDLGHAAIFPGTVNTHTHAWHALLRGLGDDRPLLEWLRHVYGHGARFTPEHAHLGAMLAFAEMARNGVTTVVDFFYLNGQGSEYALETIRAAEAVGIRLVLARTFMDWADAPATIKEDVPTARARYAELSKEYRAHPTVRLCPAAHSLYGASVQMLEAARGTALDEGKLWHVHMADARGAEEMIRARYQRSTVRRMAELNLLGPELVAVHAIHVDEAEVARLAEAGVKVSHNPSANMFLGEPAAPVLAMRRAGICVGLGTDSALDHNTLSIFHEMKTAALIHKSAAGDPRALTADGAIEMATVNGATITEWPVGRLAPGHCADFVVLDLDDPALLPDDRLESHLAYSLADRAIREVWVAGRPIVRDRRLTGLDTEAFTRRVREASRPFFRA